MSAYKLGDIVIIKKGRKVEDTSDVHFDGSKRFIQIDDLRNDNKIKYTKSDGIYATENDVLIAWDGANAGTVGYGLSGVIGSTIACLETDKDQFSGAFIGKCLQSKFHEIRQNCTGATIPHIRRDYLVNIKIPNIDKQKQKQIVQILDTADTLRQKRKEQLNLLDDYLKSVFFEMFGDPVTNEKGWKQSNLSDVCEIQGGLQVTTKRQINPIEVPYLRVANVYRDRLNLNEVKVIKVTKSELKRTKLCIGDILIVEGHGNRTEIGRTSVWDGSIDPCVHQNHLIRIRIDMNVALPIFISNYLNSNGGRRQLFSMGKTTSGLNTISASNVKVLKVVLPPLELQKKYQSVLNGTLQTKQKMRASLYEMDNHFNALMQRYFG